MANTAQDLVDQVGNMVSFPEVALKIDEALQAQISSSDSIARLIEKDPAVSAALLRIANSAAYGARGSVGSISEAVRRVGGQELRDLTFAICGAATFKQIPNELISVEDHWKHSLYAAVAAQKIGTLTKKCLREPVFTTALLHDIGQLVMFNQAPEQSKLALEHSLVENDQQTLHLSEHKFFGFDHTEVGALLAQSWQFPEAITRAIEHHHTPNYDGDFSDLATLVNVANSMSVLMELGCQSIDDAPPIAAQALLKLGIAEDAILDIARSALEESHELINLFVG